MTFQDDLNSAQSTTQQGNIMNSFIKYYIDNELNNLKTLIVGSAPEALDTLKELADAISGDPTFFTTMANSNAALQTAIDAVQADVDQNEADSDAAVAAEASARGVAVTGEATTRQAAIDAVNALITTLQTEAAARNTRITTLEADPTTASAVTTGDAATLSSANTYTDTSVAAVQADVNQNESDCDAADAALSTRLDVLEADPTTQTAVSNEVARATSAEGGLGTDIAAVQADVDQNESDSDAADAALSGRLDTLEADPTTATAVAAVQTDVDANEASRKTYFDWDSNITKVINPVRGTGINVGNNIEMIPAAAGGRVEITGDLVLDASDLTDAANDTAAAAAGVIVGQVYHNSGALRVRLS